MQDLENSCRWLSHRKKQQNQASLFLCGKTALSCPFCKQNPALWEVAMEYKFGLNRYHFRCPHCGVILSCPVAMIEGAPAGLGLTGWCRKPISVISRVRRVFPGGMSMNAIYASRWHVYFAYTSFIRHARSVHDTFVIRSWAALNSVHSPSMLKSIESIVKTRTAACKHGSATFSFRIFDSPWDVSIPGNVLTCLSAPDKWSRCSRRLPKDKVGHALPMITSPLRNHKPRWPSIKTSL